MIDILAWSLLGVAGACVAAAAVLRRARGGLARWLLRAALLGLIAAAALGPRVRFEGPGERAVIVDTSDSFEVRRPAAEARLAILDPEGPTHRREASGPELPGALRAALQQVSERGDVVLLSDGRGAPEALLEAADDAVARGVKVHVLCPPAPEVPLAAIESVRGPVSVRAASEASLEVLVAWNGRGPSRAASGPRSWEVVALGPGDVVLGRRALTLPAGGGRVRVALDVPLGPVLGQVDPGSALTVTVALRPGIPGDPVPADDRRAWSALRDDPAVNVLWVSDRPPPAGLAVAIERVPADGLPARLAAYRRYRSVVLDDVPAAHLSERAAAALTLWARRGGGLLVMGAERAFGPGGYGASPLAEVLPLDPDPDAQSGRPLSLVVLLDRSGSMAGAVSPGLSKLRAAATAVERAARRLGEADRFGLVLFAEAPEVVYPPGPIPDRLLPDKLAAAGGTDVFPALEEALSLVRRADPEVRRHVLLISDGRSEKSPSKGDGLARLERLLQDDLVTVSVVSVGRDADQTLLERIAALGRGRLVDASAGPDAIADAIRREADPRPLSLLVPGPVGVRWGPDPRRAGLAPNAEALPTVSALARTRARPDAAIALLADTGEPVLAVGEAGAGRVAALPARVDDRHAAWVEGALEAVSTPDRGPERVALSSEQTAEAVRLIADFGPARASMGRELVVRLDGFDPNQARELPMREGSPGRYRSPALPLSERAVPVEVAERGGPVLAAGLVLPRPPGASTLEADRALLAEVARRTGGMVLEARLGPLPRVRVGGRLPWALRPWLILLAVVWLVLDLLPLPRRRTDGQGRGATA